MCAQVLPNTPVTLEHRLPGVSLVHEEAVFLDTDSDTTSSDQDGKGAWAQDQEAPVETTPLSPKDHRLQEREKKKKEREIKAAEREARKQTPAEDAANSASHLAMALGAVLGARPMMALALEGGTVLAVGIAIFLVSIHTKLKGVFRVVDHSVIYVLIAGTYTPYILTILPNPYRWAMLVAMWGLAAAGIGLKVFGNNKEHPQAAWGFYLFMGWIGILGLKPLLNTLSWSSIVWLVSGGVSYSVGVIFFVTDHIVPFFHLVFHLFIMGGTTCHVVSIVDMCKGVIA
ncbi:Hly-III related protein [Kipferlia bialata]|uniref:Hly-III related protein n=1 Tax=Kipferlia bialata TaxID=797122 RepID=A0A9K3GJ42_9EUKA|nr:Hly-III related protein [Kipferlia bialata]|eukprot:g6446.t1